MKKIFEIPELEVVRFVEADIVVCSDCHNEYECISYSDDEHRCAGAYDSDEPIEDCDTRYEGCIVYNDYTNDPYHSHYTG